MKALIILAHGSRKQESNQEIENLTNDVRALVKRKFDIVDYAFLEIAKPSLTNSIEKVVSKNSVAFGGNTELLNIQEDV